MKNETKLQKHYFNPKAPGSFSGLNSFVKSNKKLLKNIKQNEIKKWILDKEVYSLHKPVKKKFPRNKTIVLGVDDTWQADLVDVSKISKINDNFKYLLTCIDVFSKYAWIKPLANKTPASIINAFSDIFNDRKPLKIHTDKGKEFINRDCKHFFAKHNVHLYTINSEMKASIVERFNRTIKEKMWRYFTYTKEKRYIHILDDLTSSYNNTYHRSIKFKPIEVTKKIQDKVWFNLYGYDLEDDINYDNQIRIKYKVGDKVRVSKFKTIFEKGYTPNWTSEIFLINKIIARDKPVYIVKDFYNEIINGVFYESELQKVN